jgi:hypothetical protein
MPNCKEVIVDPSGAMLGKVAHIHAAEPGGARYSPSMSDEDRRGFENLFIVCGKHHDFIDYKENEKDYPAELLRKYKHTHESRFRTAERQLLQQFIDSTQTSQPTYPVHLNALFKALNYSEVEEIEDEVRGIRDFIDNLRELPLTERNFALAVAERMRRRGRDTLPVDDVMGALRLSATALKRHMKLLEDHGLGSIDEGSEPNSYFVTLSERERGGNPWIEILDFCDATGHSSDELVHDLNFALYDG